MRAWWTATLALALAAGAGCADAAGPQELAQGEAPGEDAGQADAAGGADAAEPGEDVGTAEDAGAAEDVGAAEDGGSGVASTCPEGRVEVEAPGARVGPWDDVSRGVAGVQVRFRLRVTLPGGGEGAVATLEHRERQASYGGRVAGGVAEVGEVTLAPGENRLTARVDGAGGCWAATEVTVTLEAGVVCAGDLECGWGESCQGGWCRGCAVTCDEAGSCGAGEFCAQGCGCQPRASYVLIEDLYAGSLAGSSPGTDLDAVGLTSQGGSEIYASRVEGAQIPTAGNSFADPRAALGPPDAACRVQGFVSLGGAAAGGYVIVSFGEATRRRALQEGDLLTIYEVGRRGCPESTYQDEPYRVSVSASTDLATFVEVGQGGPDAHVIPIHRLP